MMRKIGIIILILLFASSIAMADGMAGWLVIAYGYFSKDHFGLDGEVLSFSRFLLFSNGPRPGFVASCGLSEQVR